MRITESRLRSIIRSIIHESSYARPLKYNDIAIEFYDGGEWFMYGEVNLFNESIKNNFAKLDPKKVANQITEINKDEKLDDKTKKSKILSMFKPFKDAFLDPNFSKLLSNVRICKLVSLGNEGKEGFVFYDMPLDALVRPIQRIDQYQYFGEASETDGDESNPKHSFKRLLKHLEGTQNFQNFQEIDNELIKVCRKLGTFKLIFRNHEMMKGVRSADDMRDILTRENIIKSEKYIERQFEFNGDTQSFEVSS